MKAVITGGSFAGKTTIVELFSRLGHPTVPESGQHVTDELIRKMGIQSMNDFRRNRPYQYLEMIIKRQGELESRPRPSRIRPTLLDRSLYDYLAYLRVAGIRPPESFLARLTQRYDRVFLMDTLSGFSHRLETGRTLNRGFSIKWRDACSEVYKEYGMDTIPVNEMPVTERMRFIKEHLRVQEPESTR